jgi:hypothetical protein
MRISREALYASVWSRPMRALAREYGVSDVALKKHCTKLNVPVPGRGYWAKKAAGKAVRRVHLPPPKPGITPESTDITGHGVAAPVIRGSLRERLVWEQEQFEGRAENRITVPETPNGLSRVVRQTRAALRERGAPSSEGRVYTWREGDLNVKVTTDHVDRAMRIMHALLAAFEARGFRVAFEKEPKLHAIVHVRGQRLWFRLVETVRRETRELEKPKKPGQYVSTYPRYNWHGTGRLCLELGDAYGYGKWVCDTKRRRLEDSLNDAMVALVEVAEAERVRHEEAAEWQRRRAEEQRREIEAALARHREEQRIKQLEDQAAEWSRARAIRAFVQAVEDELRHRAPNGEIPDELSAWIFWARGCATRLDPLSALDTVHAPNEAPQRS